MTRRMRFLAAVGLASVVFSAGWWLGSRGGPAGSPARELILRPAEPATDDNERHLREMSRRIQLAEKAPDESQADEWGRLIDDLGRPFPCPDAVTRGQQDWLEAALRIYSARRREATRRLEGRLSAKTWDEQKGHVAGLMERLDFAAAAEFLDKSAAVCPESERAKLGFLRDLRDRLTLAAAKIRTERAWSRAVARIDEALVSSAVTRLAGREGRDELASWRIRLAGEHDRTLYSEILGASGDVSGKFRAEVYLREAPLRTMKSEVERYLDWQASLQSPTETQFMVRIVWGDWYDSGRTNVRLTVGDTTVIDHEVPAAKKGESPVIPSDKIILVPGEKIRIELALREASRVVLVSERLEGAYQSDLWSPRQYDGSPVTVQESRKTQAIIQAVLPPRPDLPTWEEKNR